jgi:hypothetical protein
MSETLESFGTAESVSAAAPELTAAIVIERIADGAYPPEVVATIARGFLPLSQDELVAVLAYLGGSDDAEIGAMARTSLSELPARTILGFAENESVTPDHLRLLALVSEDEAVLETLIRNRSVSDATVAELATRVGPTLQEVIVINHSRILRAPEILDALLSNPKLTADARRRVDETREEFFEKKARIQQQQEAEAAENAAIEEAAGIEDLLKLAAAVDEAATGEATIPELSKIEQQDVEKVSLWTKILKMTVGQKVQLAFKTDKTGRMILVRDRNRLVCSAVMRNPRITEQEVEMIAGMRNVDDEVLRLITMRREWMAKYPIVMTLARNPKAPIGIVLPLINRLTLRDLKALKDDKGISETLRTLCRKTYQLKNKKN